MTRCNNCVSSIFAQVNYCLRMKFTNKLTEGKLIRRYKRFLADVLLQDGSVVVAHCTNSGSMKTCIEEGAPVFLSPATDSKRKTKFTWEMIFINGNWIGINTMIPNKLAYDAIVVGDIKKLRGYTSVKREVSFDDSRFDIYAENETEKCFVEVKNVTMKVDNFARFPDAVTTRGQKHLKTLIKVRKSGIRAVMLYIIQRIDVDYFGIADNVDPEYGKILREAMESGVEVIAIQVKVTPEEISIVRELPLVI